MFDQTGQIKDACYYNKLSAANGAVLHSGDNKSGEGHGDDEHIKIELDHLPEDIKIIVFVVTAYNKGGSFHNVKTAKAQLRDLMPNGQK